MVTTELHYVDFRLYNGPIPQEYEEKIAELEVESMQRQYPDPALSAAELEAYQQASKAARHDLNGSVGGPLLANPQQSYAREVSVIAEETGKIRGYLHAADNVSSHLPGPMGTLEQAAKMYLPMDHMRARRYLWLGQLLLCERDALALEVNPKFSSVADVLFVLATVAHDRRAQPVSLFTAAAEEQTTEKWAATRGMVQQEEHPADVHMFGPEGRLVGLRRWIGASALSMQQTLLRNRVVEATVQRAVYSQEQHVLARLVLPDQLKGRR